MAQYLLVAEQIAPLADGDMAQAASGLATALAAAKHRVVVVCVAPAAAAARQPGLARRLRTVPVRLGGGTREHALFEGRATASPVHFFVLGAEPAHRGEACVLLESAASALVRDGLVAPDAIVALGETAVEALAVVPAATRVFMLAGGGAGPPLAPEEAVVLSPRADGEDAPTLLGRGVSASTAIVVPSPTAARSLLQAQAEALARRASDQPVVPVRFGADEAPYDPSTDVALEATYSAESLTGKAACRRALARRLSLNVGPRTFVLVTEPLGEGKGGPAILQALGQLGGLDAAVVVRAGTERGLIDRANVLAIGQPGKIAVLTDSSPAAARQLLAGADAVLLSDPQDATGRAAGLALRYGALPLAPHAGAYADHLVDLDPASVTGTAILYDAGDAFAILGAIRRASALRAATDTWTPLVRTLIESTPRWSHAAAEIEGVRAPYA